MMDCLKDVAFDSMRGVFDIDKATAKMSQKSRDSVHELLTVIGSLQGDGSARVEDVVNEMVARKLLSREKVEQMIDQFLREGRLISPRYGLVKLV
jgi:DNA replicative helicase MCM subunit Mcm2 (Cdc46/Mcm family)